MHRIRQFETDDKNIKISILSLPMIYLKEQNVLFINFTVANGMLFGIDPYIIYNLYEIGLGKSTI